ncbi:aldo/keto reductase [Subtercola sp. YIM 133946]|uniref:aldo/keto reductase n=1 Tax=Subtercola sp. YIM 133946 TaxID=3118909 RepID=UPI002F957360
MELQDARGWIRELGSTGVHTSAVIAGGSPLGDMSWAYGYRVDKEHVLEFISALLDSPIRSIDTSNAYSDGENEEWIGEGIRRHGPKPDDFTVFTKVDPTGMTYTNTGISGAHADYSAERVRRSLDESEERLGIHSLPLVYLHDPEFHDFARMTGPGGAVEALVELKAEGRVQNIGVALGNVHEAARYLDLGVFDALLTHNRWTLVDRSAGDLYDQAAAQGVAVVNAAVYGGGLLAKPITSTSMYGYAAAAPEIVTAVTQMAEVCRRYGTDLATAALQFSVSDPRISATAVGLTKIERIATTVAAAETTLPADLWAELDEFVPAPEFWLDARSV